MTSASAGEGKTTIIINLALALVEIKRRVLLVDCDIRKPRLSEVFGFSNRWGMVDVLTESIPINEYPSETLFRKTEIPNLNLMTSGTVSSSVPTLLGQARPSQRFERARCEFELVLVDTPPIYQIADARVIGTLSDGVILVVRAGKTTQESVLAAIQQLHQDGATILGTILNDWDPKGRHILTTVRIMRLVITSR